MNRIAHFQRALNLNPNFAAAHGYLGWTLSFDGQSDKSIAHSQTAIRMSPHDPQQVVFYGGMAAAHYLAGRYEEAISSALSALRYRPHSMERGGYLYPHWLKRAGSMRRVRTRPT